MNRNTSHDLNEVIESNVKRMNAIKATDKCLFKQL